MVTRVVILHPKPESLNPIVGGRSRWTEDLQHLARAVDADGSGEIVALAQH